MKRPVLFLLYATIAILMTACGGGVGSTDGGTNFNALEVRALRIDPATPATLYTGTFIGGAYKSTTGGQ